MKKLALFALGLCALAMLPWMQGIAAEDESGLGPFGDYVRRVFEAGQLAAEGDVRLSNKKIAAALDDGELTVSFPFRNGEDRKSSVSYAVALYDLKGKRLDREDGTWQAASGESLFEITLDNVRTREGPHQEIDYVLSYRFTAGGRKLRGKKSLYYVLPKPALAAALPERFYAGAATRVPLVVRDAVSKAPYARQKVVVMAQQEGGRKVKRSAVTDESGAAMVTLPPFKKGTVSLEAVAKVRGASRPRLKATANVAEETKVFVSLDKPLYQPGQTMHIRALVLRKPDMLPAALEDTLFEIFDPKGNKVFKQVGKTNRFGVVSAEFTLANQVNKGKYNILLTAGDNQLEKSVTVDRYVLPKFKITLELDKAFYQPSQELSGTIDARYFFGKPVSDAAVKVTVYDYQAKWVADRVIEGAASEEGIFHFDYKLPSKLVGQPVEGGKALMLVEAEVVDGGGQKQKVARQVTVSPSPMEMQLIAESGSVVPGVENNFFVVLSDPGGNPVPGVAKVKFSGGATVTSSVDVDGSGLALVSFTPAAHAGSVQATVYAESEKGDKANKSFSFSTAGTDAKVLLRTERSILKVGESLVVDVLTSGAVSDAYLDVTKENQTVSVASVRLEDGRGRYKLDLDPSLSGTLAISAYVLSERGEFTRDSRVVFVESSDDLDIDIKFDREQYKPGEKARVDFSVENAAGKGVLAALGIHVVDEAVFALSESKPGLLKLFFALEEELLKPSYQIGRMFGQTLGSLIIHAGKTEGDEHRRVQTNAQAAIAAQGDVELKRIGVSTGLGAQSDVRERLDAHTTWLQAKLTKALKKKVNCSKGDGQFGKEIDGVLKKFRRDPWGNKYEVSKDYSYVQLDSSGPDEVAGNWDDLSVTADYWSMCPQPKRHLARHKFAEGGGGRWDDAMVPMAARGAGPPRDEIKKMEREEVTETTADQSKATGKKKGGQEVRVRKWFPETLFVENCLITDDQGRASVEIPLADSITSWRMSTVASDLNGNLGGTTAPMVVFQDFFVDIDFPVFLTRNDRIEFPVVVYNYLEEAQEVSLEVKEGDWFKLQGDPSAKINLEPGQVASVSFPVQVTRVGWHALTVYGRGSAGFADAVQRTVQVRPDGMEVPRTASGRFKEKADRVELQYDYPPSTVEGSQQLVVQVLPGLSTHVVQGMDSMLKLPGG